MLLSIRILMFSSVLLVVTSLVRIILYNRINIKTRLRTYGEAQEIYKNDAKVTLKESILNSLGGIVSFLIRDKSLDKTNQRLSQAGVYIKGEEFIGICIFTGFITGIILYLITLRWVFLFLGILIGYRIPKIILSNTIRKRMKRLNSQLPDALTIISNGLRAGFSFIQAMGVAANETDNPIRDEFKRVLRDNSVGKNMDDALLALSYRTDDEDIDMFVTALIIQRKVGGNLAEILDTISATIRDRIRIRGEVKTLTVQGRLSALIISFLPFGLATFIYIANPDYLIELFTSTIGIFMVVTAIILQVMGIIIILRMANIRV